VDPPHVNLSLADGSPVWLVLVYGILVSTGSFFLAFRFLVCLILKLTWPSLQIVGAGHPALHAKWSLRHSRPNLAR
jgi:hypothetical protein